MVNATCAVCGSSLEYESQCSGQAGVAIDEQSALSKWITAHNGCSSRAALRAQAAIAAFPGNLARAAGLETMEDARRARAAADSLRDADALLAKLLEV